MSGRAIFNRYQANAQTSQRIHRSMIYLRLIPILPVLTCANVLYFGVKVDKVLFYFQYKTFSISSYAHRRNFMLCFIDSVNHPLLTIFLHPQID